MTLYWEIFLTYFKIGLFSIGGGHAALPIVQDVVVNQKAWLSMMEFTDMLTITEMTPGPLVINNATFVGNKLAGVPGGLVATLSCMLPSFLIVLLLAYLYKRYKTLTAVNGALYGIRPAVNGLIAGAALSLLLVALFGTNTLHQISFGSFDFIMFVLILLAFIFQRKRNVNPIIIILSCGAAGLFIYSIIGI